MMLEKVPVDMLKLDNPSHVGIAVEDVRAVAGDMAHSFGVGPFGIREVATPAHRGTVRGEAAAYTLRFGYARCGPITLELIEPVAGETIYDEFLAERGPGLHHLGFICDSTLDEELERYRRAGYRPLMTHRREDTRYGWAYLDTGQGFLIEILCDPPLGWWQSRSLAEDLKGPLGEMGTSEDQDGPGGR